MLTHRAAFTALSSLSLSLFAVACSDAHSQGPPPQAAAVPVRVVAVERTVLDPPLHAVGRLGQKRSLSLAFKNGGTVRALLVAEGATVKKGQRLAVVDRTEIDAQVAQARAAVDKADRDKARVEKLHASAAAAQNDFDNAGTAAELAHATLEAALYNQTQTVLVAPEDGRVDKRFVEVGEQVAPGRPIYGMSGSAGGVVVRVGVIDRELPGLGLGDSAEVAVDALPGRRFPARVSEISRVPSIPSGTYEIELRLSPTDAALAAGMTAKVDIARKPSAPLLVVPLTALVDADGAHAAVFALQPDGGAFTVRRVEITIARFAGDRVGVFAGLRGDERIVSEGASFVEPGRRVRPIAVEVADAHR